MNTLLEGQAVTAQATPRPKRKKIGTILLAAALLLVVGIVVGQWIWLFSGSGQWEVVSKDKGVEVDTMKYSGSRMNRVRGTVQVHSTLRNILALMTDPNLCEDIGCYDRKVLRQIDGPEMLLMYSQSKFNYDFPLHPMKPREYITTEMYSQDPKTGTLTYEVTAAAAKTPADDCCVRVTHMDNVWHFTPKGDGKIDVEYIMDMDEGGMTPAIFLNHLHPMFIGGFLTYMQPLLDKEQSKNLNPQFAFFKE